MSVEEIDQQYAQIKLLMFAINSAGAILTDSWFSKNWMKERQRVLNNPRDEHQLLDREGPLT